MQSVIGVSTFISHLQVRDPTLHKLNHNAMKLPMEGSIMQVSYYNYIHMQIKISSGNRQDFLPYYS